MSSHRGFTLIEVMVALACMIGVLSLTTQLSMSLYATWKKTAQSVQTRMALHAAIDVMRRDLERAPCKQASHESASHESVGLESITHEHVSYESASHKPALKSVAQWYVTGPHEIIWHDTVSPHDLRIAVVKGRLERCEGTYDKRTQQWHSRSVSVLAQDIKELRCAFHTKAIEIILYAHNGFEERVLIALGVGALS